MTTDDWNQVWTLFQRVRDLPPAGRRALLAESGAEPHVLAEVEAMLDADEPEPEPPAPGRQYGRYTLVAPLGAGGMGEVFSARDTELGRLVAIKFVGAKGRLLPSAMERLVREAQAASALNHPNLVTVHEVLRFDSGVALVAELVKGQSLRTFCGVPRPVPQVATWGAQIARALAAAHAEAIVHGDIKPENIMLRGDGYIKILDFGLAQQNGVIGGLASLPLGTLGYMSPEQTTGEKLTGASDVFSLGVVLLELSSGKHPFLESTASSTTMAINQRQVEIPAPAIAGGQRFAKLLRAMLDKDPAKRPGAAEVATQLDQIVARAAPAKSWRRWIAGAAAAVAVLAGATWWLTRDGDSPVAFGPPVALTKYSGIEQQPALSPDGTRMLFIWSGTDASQDDLYLRPVNSSDDPPVRITSDQRREFSPVWSPDGQSIAWQRRALDGGPTDIMVASVSGTSVGPARVVVSVRDHEGFYGLAWWPDSQSLVTRDLGPVGYALTRIFLADARKVFLTAEPNVQDYRPVLSPDGTRMLFQRSRAGRATVCRLELAGPVNQDHHCILPTPNTRPVAWMADSRSILYNLDQVLWQLNLEAGPAARPRKVLEGVFSGLAADASGKRYAFSRTITDSNIWRLELATGRASQFLASSEEDSEPQYSPDGSKVLFRSNRTGAHELYVVDADGGNQRQLTSLKGHLGSARWSPDGKWIAFDTAQEKPGPEGRTEFENIYVMPASGGPARRITGNDIDVVVPGWSADSNWVYYARGKERETWKAPREGGPSVRVTPNEMWDAMESPGGKWIWYEKAVSGKGIWRRAVTGGPEELVPGTEDLAYRTWDVRGDILYFLRGGANPGFVEMKLSGGPARLVGPPPRRLLHGPRTMAVSPDGRYLLYTSEDLTIGDIFLMEVTSR